jgi:hypothetical protein
MSIVLDGTTGLAGAATGALNGTLGATTPSTVAATTITASGVATFSAGSAASPAITTTGDTNTGVYSPAADTIAWTTGGTERMRIDGSGNLLVGTTTQNGLGGTTIGAGSSQPYVLMNATAATSEPLTFRYNSTTVGKITQTTSATSYVTSSDYRLKENIAPMTGALDKVALLKPVTYNWKLDGSDGQGFIAHELAEVCPDAVQGEKDAVNEDGSIKPQGIDTSFLVATLTAAIQELNAKFEEYKASHP